MRSISRFGLFSVLFLFLCAAFAAQPAAAQVLYGSIVGQVADTSGAVVPGATVRVTNRETNQTRQTTANDAGGFSFPTLPGGMYDVQVTKDGFQTFTTQAV